MQRLACSRCLITVSPLLVPSKHIPAVLIRTGLPTPAARPLTAPLVPTSLPSTSQQLVQSATCWPTCSSFSIKGALPAAPDALGWCKPHPPGYRLPDQDSGQDWGWDCGRGSSSVTLGVAYPLSHIPRLTGTGGAAVLGPRGQQLAGRAAHQAGTLPPVTAKARRPLRLQL